jgi:hypothetical protein
VRFCDLVGFTARAEQMDPEDVRALLSPYHARVRAELERHGGTVEKFIGDAVMAVFGAPVAHEDDPERAVRAALAIRDFATEERLELRIGITKWGRRSSRSMRAQRPVRAWPGQGQGGADRGLERDGSKVAPWRRCRPPRARSELVGRERDLDALRDAFDCARQERIPQLVTRVGVPGIGKSRLVYELSRFADADSELVTWRQGRCLAYGDGVAYWALAEMVKAQAGVHERDGEEEAAGKLRASVEATLADERDARWVESHLRPLVGLETDTGLGGDRQGEAFAAWRRFLEALAEQRPLVLVFEDLHWADEGLLDFVDELVDWLTDVPVLVVGSARPGLLERRPGSGGGKLNAQESRAFQPDPLMLMLAALGAILVDHQHQTRLTLVLAGLLTASASLVKPGVALFFCLPVFAALALLRTGLPGVLGRRSLGFLALAVLPTLAYYITQPASTTSSRATSRTRCGPRCSERAPSTVAGRARSARSCTSRSCRGSCCSRSPSRQQP